VDSSCRRSKEASTWQHWIRTNEVRSDIQRKRLLSPTCPPVCPSVCPSFCIYHCNSLWKDFCEMLTQGTSMEIWQETANHFTKSGWKYQDLYMGTEVLLIATGDINSPIKNCCTTFEILVILKESGSTHRQHNFLFTATVVLRKGHSYVIPVPTIAFITGLID